nr:MAG TPA: hypothetical protein [Caudoviricetes sp.]
MFLLRIVLLELTQTIFLILRPIISTFLLQTVKIFQAR